MIFIITERQIVYSLVKMRRMRSLNRRRVGDVYHSSNLDDYVRATYGIEEDFFIHKLFSREFSYYWFNKWLVIFYEKLRPVYFEFFHTDLKEVIKSCIKSGYIEPQLRENKIFIKETAQGRKLLSVWFFPRIILGNVFVKAVIISAITLITSYYLGRFLGISLKT